LPKSTETVLPVTAALAPATILLGLDDKHKRHASYFIEGEAERAAAAAQVMGMITLPVTDTELSDLALQLPRGKIFGSGKAFVPFVGEKLFEQLSARLPDPTVLKNLRAAAKAAEEEAASSNAISPTLPKDWDTLKVGDLVLATEGDQEGWWEAVVKGIAGGNLSLRWRDWPDEPPFMRRPEQVALMWAPPETTPSN
jgi:hypothetical protein